MRELDIVGTYNVRDLEGHITASGDFFESHVLIRAGNLDKLSEESQQKLLEYGVKTIMDVRDEWEAEHYPNPFEHSKAISYHNLPLIGDEFSDAVHLEASDYADLNERYIKYIEKCQTQIGKIISTIIDSETGIIIHCHAGKDRTGIIIALMLASIGVSEDEIAEDYVLSHQNIQHLIAEWRTYAESKGHDMAQFERENATLPETILTMLAHIEKNFGSVDMYLQHCGLSTEQLNLLKTQFLV
ncbi:MAG: tyrosine-protein phosphatase [Phototrophicaceae bacterium]